MGKKYSVKKVYVAACAGITIFGVVMLALGAILGQLEARIPGAVGLPKYMSVGIIIGTLFFGPIVDKFGYKWMMVGASSAALAGLIGLALLDNLGLLTVSIFILGAGGGMLNGETSAIVSDIYDDKKRGSRMSIMSAFYCIGALCWTLSCSLIENYMIPLSIAIVLTILFIAYFCMIDFPKSKGSSVSYLETLKLMKYPVLLLFAFVLFFQSGFEGAVGNYVTKFLIDMGTGSKAAVLTLTMYTVGMLFCRLTLGAIIGKVKDMTILVSFLSIGLIGSALLLFVNDSQFIPYASLLLIGFGSGATFPAILSRIGTSFPSKTGSAFSAAMFISLCGNYGVNFATEKSFVEGLHITPLFSIGGVEFYGYVMILCSCVVMMLLFLPVATSFAKKESR